ncbi:MAG: hypothetical protein AB1671_09340 [Thermodesulfobacteriota bacterium]|jgi:hypothetical protein
MTWSRIATRGVAILLLLGGFAPVAQGQGGPQLPYGGAMRGMTRITGTLVCAECSLEEARRANPDMHDLYVFDHDLGQAVIQVNQVLDSAGRGSSESIVGSRWEAITWYPELAVRAPGEEFRKLLAEENMFKEVQITGILRSTRTLDVMNIDVLG